MYSLCLLCVKNNIRIFFFNLAECYVSKSISDDLKKLYVVTHLLFGS